MHEKSDLVDKSDLGGIGVAAPFACLGQTNLAIPPEGQLTTRYRVEIVASRLQAPWAVVFTPDRRIFFSERPGWVRVIVGGRVLQQPALLLKDVAASVKMGLLGLAVDPDMQTILRWRSGSIPWLGKFSG